jgi:hypothetical protein
MHGRRGPPERRFGRGTPPRNRGEQAAEPHERRLVHARGAIAPENGQVAAVVVIHVEPRPADLPQRIEQEPVDLVPGEVVGTGLVQERLPEVLPDDRRPPSGEPHLTPRPDELGVVGDRRVEGPEHLGADAELGDPDLPSGHGSREVPEGSIEAAPRPAAGHAARQLLEEVESLEVRPRELARRDPRPARHRLGIDEAVVPDVVADPVVRVDADLGDRLECAGIGPVQPQQVVEVVVRDAARHDIDVDAPGRGLGLDRAGDPLLELGEALDVPVELRPPVEVDDRRGLGIPASGPLAVLGLKSPRGWLVRGRRLLALRHLRQLQLRDVLEQRIEQRVGGALDLHLLGRPDVVRLVADLEGHDRGSPTLLGHVRDVTVDQSPVQELVEAEIALPQRGERERHAEVLERGRRRRLDDPARRRGHEAKEHAHRFGIADLVVCVRHAAHHVVNEREV